MGTIANSRLIRAAYNYYFGRSIGATALGLRAPVTEPSHLQSFVTQWLPRPDPLLWLVARAVVVIIALFSYGLFLPLLGIAWDDWNIIGIGYHNGADGLARASAADRPLVGLVYGAFYSMLGVGPLGWHIARFMLHLGSALVLLSIGERLWPARRLEVGLVSFLFVAYPSVLTQPTIIQIGQNLALFSSLLSIWLTIVAIQSFSHRFIRLLSVSLAVALAGVTPFFYEASLGLEFIRLVTIWVALNHTKESSSDVGWKVFLWMIPFAVVGTAFAIFRLFFMGAVFGDNRGLSLSTIDVAGAAFEIAQSIVTTLLWTWSFALKRFFAHDTTNPIATRLYGLDWLVVAFSGTVILIFIVLHSRRSNRQVLAPSLTRSYHDIAMAVLGVFATICGLLPFVLDPSKPAASPLGHWTRATYFATVGASVVWVFGISALVRWLRVAQLRFVGFLSIVLIMIAVGSQIRITKQWRDDWKLRRSVFWQLSWRAPQLKENTLIVVLGPTDQGAAGRGLRQREFSIPIEIFYGLPENSIAAAFAGEENSAMLSELISKGRVLYADRVFNRREQEYGKDNVIVLRYGQGCLKVVDRQSDLSMMDGSMRALGALSNVANIIEAPGHQQPRPSSIFGTEPTHDWCFYYEKASWDAQRGDLKSVIALYKEAEKKDLKPDDSVEYLPFFQANIRTGDYDAANKLAASLAVAGGSGRDLAVDFIKNSRSNGGPEGQYELSRLLKALGEA